MNVIVKRPAPASLEDRYAGLPPDLKHVMRLKSLVVPSVTKADFAACLTESGLRGPAGKALLPVAVNAMLNDLIALGLLTRELECLPAIRHNVAVDAIGSDDGSRMIDAIKMVLPARKAISSYYTSILDHAAALRLARLAIYANDPFGFVAAAELCDKTAGPRYTLNALAGEFANAALSADWFAGRDPAIQVTLLDIKIAVLMSLGVFGADLPDLIGFCRQQVSAGGNPGLRPVLLTYDVFAGRPDGIRDGVAALGPAAGYIKPAMEATISFLEGANDAALPLFRDSLKQLRKTLSRRKVFLPGAPGVFFLLALLRANDAQNHPEIQTNLDAALAEEHTPLAGALHAVQALLWLVQGLEAKARDVLKALRASRPSDPLAAACVALAEYLVDPDVARGNAADTAARFETFRDILPLIARIHAEILAAVANEPGPHTAWLRNNGGGFPFTRLIQTRAPWERALESLEAFLGGGENPDAAKAARKARRLVWFLDPDSQEVTVAEQSAKGRDGWTDGRPVAMKRLHEQDPRLDYLTAADRTALRTIRKDTSAGWYNEETWYFDTDRTIAALVGHPAVFDARQRSVPLELVAYPLELLVTEQGGGYRIALSHTAEEPTVFLEAETPTRYRVVEFTKPMLAVQEILGSHGLTVPAAAREQVVAMVRRNNPSLPIRAEIAEVDQPGLDGEATPVVQLVPYADGLKLTLLVRPFGANGPAYVAGLGGRSVLATVGGRQMRANRDLPRELAERTALIEACPTLRDRGGADMHELVVEDLEGGLDMLLEIQAYAGPVSVEWPEGRTMRVSAVTAGKMKLRVAQDRDWFAVDGSVVLDEDQVLDMRFLLDRLDKAQGRFVSLGDGRFVALTRQLQAQLQRLSAVSEPSKAGRRVHALGAPALNAVLEGAGEVKSDAAWKTHVSRIRAAEGWTPVLPDTLQAELRDYQVEGFVWMSRLARWGAGACLADDMGLGKTVQAIAVMLDRSQDGPCLVIAPTSVCPNWQAEISRFAPTLTVHRLTGDRAELIAGLGPRDVLVCSYGLLQQSAEALGSRPWQMLVLDEAQAIKNAETKRAQAVQGLQAGFRLALTGTPVENYLDELWSLFSFVNPGVLGSREGFQKRFARPIERDKDVHARQALRALLKPFLLRRTKAAVLSELPPRTEQTLTVEMGDGERAFYEALRQRSLERIAALDGPEGRRKIQILAEITRLRRACCNPALIDPAAGVTSGKLAGFMDLVEDLIRNRHKALVFSQFVGHLELVRAALDAKSIRYEYLDGGTSSPERERRVAAFQSGSADLFLISLKAGGTGLNLTAADYVVHLDPWWNPAVEDQASDRAHRIGQERPVTIYRLVMQDSIEQQILGLHRDKRDLASELLDGTETAGRLSEEALLDLIRG